MNRAYMYDLNRVTARNVFAACLITLLMFGCGGGGSGDTTGSTSPDGDTNTPGPTSESDGLPSVMARTGPIVTVRVGETVELDGTKSNTSASAPLQYQWVMISKPDKSLADIQDVSSPTPSFVADEKGAYVAQLVVSADGIDSRRAISLAVASVAPEALFHQGLSADCINCHTDEQSPIPGKPATHIATTETCATCHTASLTGFSPVHTVDHQEIFGSCSECHNGTVAIGKSELHLPTEAECDSCHTTDSFIQLELDGTFDHSGVTNRCEVCHNGSVSTGKTPTPPHPETDVECGFCHTTESFANAFPDHTSSFVLDNRCDSCHGVSATGPSVGHPTPLVDCNACHSVAKFSLDGVFHHRVDPALQPCESCHNDDNSINAIGKSAAVPSHPATTEDCITCHNTTSFADAIFDHTGIVDNCASCHGVTATGKHAEHLPTTDDCSVCHTTGTFATGVFDHVGIVDNCESCHNNTITLGKLANHLPTVEDCVNCHNTTDFADAVFDHAGIDTSNCAACHDGNISTGKSPNHVPTTLDCSGCHDINNFLTFAGIAYNHAGIDPNDCASCHNTGIATPRTANHIPVQDDCSTCHDSTVTFTSNFFLIQHQDYTSGCAGCHTNQFFPNTPELRKSNQHLPTAQDCSVCHTTTAFTPSVFSHEGIVDNCASCHDGSAAYVALGALGKTPIPVHDNTTSDCSICHNTTNFADAFVDHNSPEVLAARCDSCHNGVDATGKDAKPDHVTTTEDCGVCHSAGGAFTPAFFDHTGIVDNCASCHNGTDATGKSAKMNPDHIPTNEDCSVCHVTTSFAQANFNHQGIVDNCADCHNGNIVIGKGSEHVPTNADCVNCHVTTGFVPATFDHQGIVDNCASCHDAGFATGKSQNHLATNQDCGVCHNTTAFVPATFDHTGIVDNCESCHDGGTAIGKHDQHIDTTADCHFCHTTATFVGGTWVHDASTAGRCDDCHNDVGGGATFKPANHLATNVQCDVCHSTDSWAPTNFAHDPNGNYPGDHRRDPGCEDCHGPSVNAAFNYPFAQYAPFCAACHANDFDRTDEHIGGNNGTVEQNKDCNGGGQGCHRVTDNNFN